MTIAKKGAAVAVLTLVCGVGTASAQKTLTDDENRNLLAYAEMLRADVRADKVSIITEVMAFSDKESQTFWPIYREYDVELSRLNDERLAGIREYAQNYEKVTDALADRLAQKSMELESRRTMLKQKFYERLKTALSPKTAARFLQVENQLLLIIDLQIAASLPIVK